MSPKVKNILLKSIYMVLIIIMLIAFVFLSEKYKDNSKEELIPFSSYYSDIDNDNYEVINGVKFINLIRNGKSIVLVGSKNSEWSKFYVNKFNDAIDEMNLDTIYYYDINNDKSQLNSNYYEILELLDGYLVSTDDSNNNLLAPSLYILENGQVLYYNIDTIARKNTDKPESYWNIERTKKFNEEIKEAINKYYLNNK